MKPKIVISSPDAERLERLLVSLPSHSFPGRDNLEAELARAEIVAPADIPPNVVTMNSTVRFKIELSLKEFYLTLVYPEDADVNGGTISITAPVGSALLGLSEGDEMSGQSLAVVSCGYQSKKSAFNPNARATVFAEHSHYPFSGRLTQTERDPDRSADLERY